MSANMFKLIIAARLDDKMNIYYSATLELLDRRLYADAFELMERSRARGMADMMATHQLSLSGGDGQQLYAESVRLRTAKLKGVRTRHGKSSTVRALSFS